MKIVKKILVSLLICFSIICTQGSVNISGNSRPDIRPMKDSDIVRISGTYGEERSVEGYVHFHTGIDFASFFGKPIYAPADGEVAFAGELNGYGWTLIIKHQFIQKEAVKEKGEWKLVDVPYVIYSLYGHCSKQYVLEGNKNIRRGDKVMAVGTTGRTTGSHLHYELRNADQKPIFNGTFQRRLGIEQGVKYKNMSQEEIMYQKLTGVW